MIVCADCGYSNPDDAEFCRSCSTFLGWEGTRIESGNTEREAEVGGGALAAKGTSDVGTSGGGTATATGGTGGTGSGAARADSATGSGTAAGAGSTGAGIGSAGAGVGGGGPAGTGGTGTGGSGSAGGTALVAGQPDTRTTAAASGGTGQATGGGARHQDGAPDQGSTAGSEHTIGQERPTDQGMAGAVLTGAATERTAATEAAQTGLTIDVRQPTARQPSRIVQRRPLRPVDEPTPQQVTGERPCPNCGRGNEPMRRFCSFCGHSMQVVAEEEKLPWWRRLLNRLTSRRPRSRRSNGVARRILKFTSALCALAVLLVAGPPLSSRAFYAVRDRLQPGDPVRPIEVIASSSHSPETLPERISDGASNRYWAPRGPAADAWVEAAFARPFRTTDILIHSGISKEQEQFLTVGRPHELALIATTDDGDTVEETLVLRDRPGEQRFTFRAKNVVRIRLVIRSTFGPESEPAVAIAEVEFFGRA